jgi:hypothetical protein
MTGDMDGRAKGGQAGEGRASGVQDRALRERAARVIPGGMYGHQSTALLPDGYPQFFTAGQGAHLTDADGRRYLDFMCAYGPNLFGYAHPGIDAAYIAQLQRGDALTGPTPAMVDLAEAFTALVSHGARPHPPQDPGVGQGRLSRRGALVRAAAGGDHARGPGQPGVLHLQRHRQPGGGRRSRGRRPCRHLRRTVQA